MNTTMVASADFATTTPHVVPRNRRSEVLIACVLGIFAFFGSLRGVGRTDVIDTDAARHAMNGAFIYDLVRTGHWSNPIEYAKAYYEQYPAISMPYHPPLFPAIEALFFAVFGVKLLVARVVVALAAAASAILLYLSTRAVLGSVVAFGVTITTFSIWIVQMMSRDVMLEFPAMAFSLAAVYCLRDIDRGYSMRRALWFAVFASAAVWTKQHAVFVGGVPILYAILERRWRRLFEAPLLISTTVFSVAVLALIRLSRMFHGTGVDQMSTSASDVYWILTRTLPAYFRWIVESSKGIPAIFAAVSIAVYLWSRRARGGSDRPKLALYFAWVIALSALLIDLGPVSPRYLFFMFPAVVPIVYAWLFYGVSRLRGERLAAIAVAGFAAVWFIAGFFIPMDFLRGPGAAAEAVVTGKPGRVLYAGPADGNFTFSVRALDPDLQMTVIPAGKIAQMLIESVNIEAFCAKYGIEWVVFEKIERPGWHKLYLALQKSGTLVKTVPLESTRWRWRTGTMEIYHFPGAPNADAMPLHAPLPAGNIGMHF